MGMNIKNPEVERLAEEVVRLTGETKTEAIRRALSERKVRLHVRLGRFGRRNSLREYLEKQVWPSVPADELGRVLTRNEEDKILGLGPEGY